MESSAIQHDKRDQVADDILEGGDSIAEFLFGSRASRRKVYYLAEGSKLAIFRLGSALCARKSVLLQFISGQEDCVMQTEPIADPPKA